MTRLIVVNHYPVLPPRNGGQLAVLGLAASLADTWPTELIWTERKSAFTREVQALGQTLTATAVPNRWLQRRLARWLRHGLGIIDADIGSMLCSGGNRRLFAHLLGASQDGDIVVLAHPWLWPAVRRLRERRKLLLVYDAHNVEHRLKREVFKRSTVADWVIDRVRRLERELVQRADLTLACTELDAQALLALAGVPRERLLVGSKGIADSPRADETVRARAARRPERVAVFVGSDHPPNNEAARWIVDVLAPACPHWRFDVAGACGPAAGSVPRTANVRILGRVEDLASLMAAAGVALNPVVEGSGINMKLFEYLQCALPVLSTPFGARGFEGLTETGLVLRERDDFATTLDTLVTDSEAYHRLGAAGAACVRERFTWSVVGARVRAGIERLLARKTK
jgi:glycosyltransferase involved in cell wall biosynthesis